MGGTIALAGSAHDSDSGPSALTYQWSATGGTISDPTAQNPAFTCATPGTATVTLIASDGDSQPGCADKLTAQVTCTGSVSGVVTSALFVPGSATEPTVQAGHYRGAKVCADANDNGKCDPSEGAVATDASGHFALNVTGPAPIIADIGTDAVNTANGAVNPTRNVFRTTAGQLTEQAGAVVISPASTEVVRLMEANASDYATEKQNLGTRLGVTGDQAVADAATLAGAAQSAVLREEVVLSGRFGYAVTKLDRGDLYPDSLAVPGGNPELTGLAGVTPATAMVADTRQPITFHQAEQAAFEVEGIPRYDNIFIVMLENKSTQAMLSSAFAPKINALLKAGNQAASYYATGNPSEPNYTALGGADDFGITDDSQWNCDATGPNAVQDLPVPDKNQPGLANSPFATTCTQSVGTNHNITGKPNVFNAITFAGMTWRTYSESMNPGQDFRTDSIADSAVVATDDVYAPGTVAGNAASIGTPGLVLPLPAGLYKTKHHPGMAYQNVRSAPEFKYSNRTLGGGQWDANLMNSSVYAIPTGYDIDQFGTDLNSGKVGNLNFVIPDQCDDMHGITVQGTVAGSTTKVTASDCSSVSNNVPVATGGNILARGDNYVDKLVKKIQASPVWQNTQKKVAIVIMFDEGNSTTGLNSCCGWKAGKTAVDNPLAPGAGGFVPDTSNAQYGKGNQGHGKSIFGVLTNQANAPKGIKDNDVYSHFSFVRTLQDMFLLADPTRDASYMNRSKYTEKFIAQNILNLPEFAGSADTHYDAVRPMNHKYVIPATYVEKVTDDDTQPLQVGPDATQTNIWSLKK
ncbi:MAG TPA: phosphoesterase [Polyangia bacterium]